METLLETIIESSELHARWLSTLSFLELCGSRKIAKFLPSDLHKETIVPSYRSELLQHCAEEFRHAYFFHQQIAKLKARNSEKSPSRFCKRHATRFLHLLDLSIARDMRERAYKDLPKACYLLTTYAIEKRAESLYALYEQLLVKHHSPISIRSILKEEEGHLRQIELQIEGDAVLLASRDSARKHEERLFSKFWEELEYEISLTLKPALASLERASFTTLKEWIHHDTLSSSHS